MDDETIVATPVWARAAVWTGGPAAGAGVGWALHELPGWLLRVPWLPLRGPLRLVDRLDEPAATFGALLLGAVAGLVLAGLIDRESLTVRLSRTEVTLTRPGTSRTVPRDAVAVAYPERDQLVLLGRTGRELAREPSHLDAGRLAAAFGPAWSARDPYAGSYHRWVPDRPDVPGEAAALFAARQRALDRGDGDDARELRDELARLGFVLRDEKKRQHFRRTDPVL
ncbi:hypothetical protein Ani05nite_14440 [Amorphoplanes nipponensis]|uniref:DUF308 domain-containing protein n=1 Tax=Actinoplanes nipponensis TaxID=135950 RepID=A0A919JEK9_9ACTN|nr:hypothetical protein [Actinoplanes nipponensis]GIE47910.1 hypothetical protein Ani05nite_14440 [Actinoplanes nipponensis]